MIKAGSTVKHIPTGEEWFLLGVNEKLDEVCVAGYPPTKAKLSDCVLIEVGEGIDQEYLRYRHEHFGFNWDE